MTRFSLTMALLLAALPVATQAMAQETALLDATIPPGANFDKANFRLWVPEGAGKLTGTLVLVPGSNGDARDQVKDPAWQEFARKHKFAIMGVQLTDKVASIVEDYADMKRGSGQAILDALSDLAKRSKHDEIAAAPLVFWGMSAGGEVNYEMAAWKPERVAAFVVNKGNFYYTAMVSKESRAVPGLLFTGTIDLQYRQMAVKGLYAMNRRGGALWALVEEPGAPHAVARSADLSRIFFDEVLPLRMKPGSNTLMPLDPAKGWLGDVEKKTIAAVAPGKPPETPSSWLPTERTAKAWAAVENGTPFEQ